MTLMLRWSMQLFAYRNEDMHITRGSHREWIEYFKGLMIRC